MCHVRRDEPGVLNLSSTPRTPSATWLERRATRGAIDRERPRQDGAASSSAIGRHRVGHPRSHPGAASSIPSSPPRRSEGHRPRPGHRAGDGGRQASRGCTFDSQRGMRDDRFHAPAHRSSRPGQSGGVRNEPPPLRRRRAKGPGGARAPPPRPEGPVGDGVRGKRTGRPPGPGAKPFDVIVTDMAMPGMDGAALLQEVVRRFPAMAEDHPLRAYRPGGRPAGGAGDASVPLQALRPGPPEGGRG